MHSKVHSREDCKKGSVWKEQPAKGTGDGEAQGTALNPPTPREGAGGLSGDWCAEQPGVAGSRSLQGMQHHQLEGLVFSNHLTHPSELHCLTPPRKQNERSLKQPIASDSQVHSR